MRIEAAQLKLRLAAMLLTVLTVMTVAADRLSLLAPLRTAVHEVLLPGRLLTGLLPDSLASSFVAAASGADPGAAVDSESTSDRMLLRQLMVENARLRQAQQQWKRRRGLYSEVDADLALLQLQLTPARVISSREGMPAALTELILDAGYSSGLRRSELVLEGDGLILDSGTTQNVAVGDRVLDGLTVVGRIERAAQWVSLVQLVHADGFRAQVRLLRRIDGGFHYGAAGILAGTGAETCRLDGIAHTEVVAVGDEVVGADVEGLNGPSLYFGQVIRAEFSAGGQWEIEVRPAVVPDEVQQVGVLRWELKIPDELMTDAARGNASTSLAAAATGAGR